MRYKMREVEPLLDMYSTRAVKGSPKITGQVWEGRGPLNKDCIKRPYLAGSLSGRSVAVLCG